MTDLRQELLQLLSQVPAAAPPAADRPDRAADCLCSACHRAFTWQGVSWRLADCATLCPACREAAAVQGRSWRPWREPLTYVLVSVLLAGGLYAAGWGNPSIARLRERDRNQQAAWRELPRLQLAQAARLSLRIRALEETGREAEIPRWAALAARNFQAAAAPEGLGGTAVEADLLLAAADMQARAGEAAAALRQARLLEARFPGADDRRWNYLFRRGQIAWRAGDAVQALADWDAVLADHAGRQADELHEFAFDSVVDHMLEGAAKGQWQSDWEAGVRARCGTAQSLPQLSGQIMTLMSRAQVSSPAFAKLSKAMGGFTAPPVAARKTKVKAKADPFVQPLEP